MGQRLGECPLIPQKCATGFTHGIAMPWVGFGCKFPKIGGSSTVKSNAERVDTYKCHNGIAGADQTEAAGLLV